MTLQEVDIHKRKEVESKRHGAAKESTSEQQRFDRTEITFSLRKNGGYIRSSLGSRSVLVVWKAGWLAGWLADENLVVCGIYKIL